MLVTILDGDGLPRVVTWQSQDLILDRSGTLDAAGAAPPPQKIADANTLRSGYMFQNTSQSPLIFYELGIDSPGFTVPAGGYFPPYGNFPIPVGEFYVQGTQYSAVDDTFTCREWVNSEPE